MRPLSEAPVHAGPSVHAGIKSAVRRRTLKCTPLAVCSAYSHHHRTWVVACGRQQNAASTPSQSTSPVLTSFGTFAAVMRCGNTAWNSCACGSGRPVRLQLLRGVPARLPPGQGQAELVGRQQPAGPPLLFTLSRWPVAALCTPKGQQLKVQQNSADLLRLVRTTTGRQEQIMSAGYHSASVAYQQSNSRSSTLVTVRGSICCSPCRPGSRRSAR